MTGRILGPGRYSLTDLTECDRIVTGRREVSAALIDDFAELTGDHFEIHMSKEAALRHGFNDRVAHGLLVLSLVDGLKNQAEAQFDSVASLGWDWQFSSPVLAGDTIGVTIMVNNLQATSDGKRGIVNLEFDVSNQRGETVQKGENRLMIYA